MVDPRIKPVAKLCFNGNIDLTGADSTNAVIYIPEEVLKKRDKKLKGMVLYFNFFEIAKDILFFRTNPEHKFAIYSLPNHISFGKQDYKAPYIKTELIFTKKEMDKISEIIKMED